MRLESIKKIVALKIDGVNDAINEKNIKNILVIIKEVFSLSFNLFNIKIIILENKDTCRPDKANK